MGHRTVGREDKSPKLDSCENKSSRLLAQTVRSRYIYVIICEKGIEAGSMAIKNVRSVLIIGNLDKEGVEEFISQIREELTSRAMEVHEFSYRGNPAPPELPSVDLSIVLGGDGTVLFSSMLLFSQEVPILGVNMGTVGFITEVVREEWKDALDKYLNGELDISKRLMIRVSVCRREKEVASFVALNDGVVSAAISSKMIYFGIQLSGTQLGEYRADGIIISTPTGSTGYSLAAGGPILHPETEGMILTPICPHSLSNRPMVVPAEEIVQISLNQKQRTDVSLTVDGRDVYPLQPGDVVRFEKLAKKAQLIRSDKRTFYEVVRAKLN